MPADVSYTVDASDAIVAVNDAWTAFALANDGALLLPPGIIGRSLWDFIAEPTTAHIYRRLFERIRSGSGAVRFPFRCDSPSSRRFLEMSIAAGDAARLDIVVRTVRIEHRPAVALLDVSVRRASAVLKMCAWCKRVPDSTGVWMEIEDALPRLGLFDSTVVPWISHGMCEDCHRVMMPTSDQSPHAPARSSSS